METVAFYSYKGGVGRSLLLANTARFLATLGKGVVALDLDLEAPGLHYKLGLGQGARRTVKEIKQAAMIRKGGAVPYLLAASKGVGGAPALGKHLLDVPVPPEPGGWLRLMPAGPAPAPEYWKALKELGERGPLDDASGAGMMALLDLQARIAEELKPDYLLIDARTGVTELGGLATTLLADTVVCLFVPNQESLDGTVAVVEALKAAPRLKEQRPVRVVPVVSRLAGEKLTGDERFTEGVKRLVELGEGRSEGQKKEPELFALPHDQALAVSERVVAGEQKASDFSPLYKAYLDLYQHLFPTSAKRAKEVLERLAAVAEFKEAMTRPHRGRYGFSEDLSPWESAAIHDGVVYEAEQHRGPGRRYVDLVCNDASGRPVMVVEYVAKASEAEAREFWAKRTRLRCVVLLTPYPNSTGASRNVYTRPPNQDDLRESQRWDPPLPKEFELLADVGDPSVEPMLDALRRGHVEAVAWLVNVWQEASSALWSEHGRMMRRHEWQPGSGRRILDGLAATEDLRCAEEILRRSGPAHEDRPHPERRFRDDMFPFSEEQLAEHSARGLLAPLFWRLPVEVLPAYIRPRRHPEERPCLAGYRLLADDLMGLSYDPDRGALAEAQAVAERSPRGKDEDDPDDRRVFSWMHRRRWELSENPHFSEEPPPGLVWDAVLAEDRWFRGTLEEAKAKIAEKTGKQLLAVSGLRGRLRGLKDRHQLSIQGLLGSYDISGKLDLYPNAISAAAEVLGVSPRYLKSVVFIYLSTWALAHQSLDLDGHPGYGFSPTPGTSPFLRESPTHVTLVQAFADRLIRRLEDANLRAAFDALMGHFPEPYREWVKLTRLPLESLRALLLKARGSVTAVGLPSTYEQG